jgi:threonine synthase
MSAGEGIWRWAGRFGEPPPPEARLSLGEGGTPLIRSRRIGPAVGLEDLWLKLESCNPTGSYKDRFAAAAVSWMRARGDRVCLATSSGNTGAALAAACAAAGLRCRIAIVETAPAGKLRQMLAYGAELARVRGFGIDGETTRNVFSRLKHARHREGRSLEVSAYALSPLGMGGVETLAWELLEEGGPGWDAVFLPAGGGGLCLATAKGFEAAGARVAVHCVQPEGNDTIAGALRAGDAWGRKLTASTTSVSGLQVPDLLDATPALLACRASGGTGHLVSDEAVYEAQRRLAREEGVFCEPAGAVALAGLLAAREAGEISPGARCVCVVTGSGFKDETSLERMADGEGGGLVEPEALDRW